MTKLCKVYASRKRALLLLLMLAVTLMVTMVTSQTWRSFAVSTLGLARHGNQNERRQLGFSTSINISLKWLNISDVTKERANRKAALNDVTSATKIDERRKIIAESDVSKNGGKTQPDERNISEAGKKCRPKKNIVFLKTHKTASSTVQNILMRYGVVRNLTFVLPHSGHLLGTPYAFSKSAVLQERFYGNHRRPHGNRTAYNILCHHIRFHYDNIRDLMPNDTVYVTIVRNPVDMFESAFQYYGFGTKYNISQPNALKTFLENPSSYVKKFGERRHSHNALFYDLGYDNENLTSEQTIKSTIRHLDRIFSVVMVADHFEESLILLKHALCWDLDDVTFFKINSRNEKSVRHVTTEMAGKIRQWNKADVMLFDHYNKTLWSKLSRLPKTWRKEVEKLKERNLQLRNACVRSDRATGNEVDETMRGFQPKGISINGFVLKDVAKNNATCRRMVTPEVPFTKEVQRMELRKLGVN